MKVKMNIWISGTRNGEPWPPPGKTIDLPDVEALKLCASGQAEAVTGPKDNRPPVESAAIDTTPRKRG